MVFARVLSERAFADIRKAFFAQAAVVGAADEVIAFVAVFRVAGAMLASGMIFRPRAACKPPLQLGWTGNRQDASQRLLRDWALKWCYIDNKWFSWL